MNTKNTTVITLAALTLIAGSATLAHAADTSLGVVNVSGTVGDPGGGTVKIDLVNGNGVNVGSGSYTTSAGNSDGHVANKIRNDFSGAGFKAVRRPDKSDGTEVIEFFRKKNGGQPATISITNGEGSITVTEKATSGAADANFSIDSVDVALGFMDLEIYSEGFFNPEWSIESVSFGDGVSVDAFSVMDDLTMLVSISWDPSDDLLLGTEAVFIEGFDLGDDDAPFDSLALWVVDGFTFTPAPGPAVLAGLAGLAALRRNRKR